MKKKLVLVFIFVFCAVFLLWPAYVADTSATASCNDGVINGEADCGPPHKPRLGGGIRYVSFVLHAKTNDPASDYNHYFFLDNNSYIEVEKDLIASTILALAVLAIIYGYSRVRPQSKKQ